MFISIVMTTYNGEKYILEQLNSLKNQTRPADEVVIYDDGSMDGTVEIINSYICRNDLKKWKLIINEKNKGWRKNFYEGICASKGDIVFPCDQDDIWHKNKIKIMEEIMEKNQEIDLLASEYKCFTDETHVSFSGKDTWDIKRINQKNNIFGVTHPGCTFCIRRRLIEKSKDNWMDIFPHDAFFWRCSLMDHSLYEVKMNLVKWRMHKNSSFSQEKASKNSINKKLEWIDYAKKVVLSLRKYIIYNSNQFLEDNCNILDYNYKWLTTRKAMFETKKLRLWLTMSRYLDVYPQKRQYLFDLYYIFKGE